MTDDNSTRPAGRLEEYRITRGVYRYVALDGCHGEQYRVLAPDVTDVPSYQHKVLVRCLSGKDKGLLFTVSPSNFSYRYVRVEDNQA